MITTQHELRRRFWQDHPELSRKKIPGHSGAGTMFKADTRVAWVDWIDSLCRAGDITEALAGRATLD